MLAQHKRSSTHQLLATGLAVPDSPAMTEYIKVGLKMSDIIHTHIYTQIHTYIYICIFDVYSVWSLASGHWASELLPWELVHSRLAKVHICMGEAKAVPLNPKP